MLSNKFQHLKLSALQLLDFIKRGLTKLKYENLKAKNQTKH